MYVIHLPIVLRVDSLGLRLAWLQDCYNAGEVIQKDMGKIYM